MTAQKTAARETINDITRKIKTLEIECLRLFKFIILYEVIFSASGSHSNNT